MRFPKQLRLAFCGLAVIVLAGGLTRHRVETASLDCSVAVTSVTPGNGLVVGDAVSLVATVTNTCQLQSVVASAPGTSAPLSFNASAGNWQGTLSVASLPRGSFTLTVTATDVFSNVATGMTTPNHDRKPTITIISPEVNVLARPMARLTGTCQDDDPAGCSLIQVRIDGIGGTKLAESMSSSIDQDVSLASREGQKIALWFIAVDSAGQTTTAEVPAYVESSPLLIEDFRGPGTVLDDSATRALVGLFPSQTILFDKTTGTSTVLADLPGRYGTGGYLTPAGAIFETAAPASPPGDRARLYEYSNGSLAYVAVVPRVLSS